MYEVWKNLCLPLAYVYSTLTFLTFPFKRRLSALPVSPHVRQHVGSDDGAKNVENTDMTHASVKLALRWMDSDRTPYKRKVSGSSLVTRGFPHSLES